MVATVGVLALQGGVEEHLRILDGLGVATRRVRVPRDLDGLDGLVIPGGESSVIDKLLVDVTVRRNAFGNQRFSEERTVPVTAGEETLDIEASFIRAPLVTRVGEGVEVIATVPGEDGDAVVGVRQGRVTALSFHPEENGDARVHAAWLDSF